MKLDITFDSGAFNKANNIMRESLDAHEAGETGESWKLNFSSRLHYLAVTIQELVLAPFATLYLVFASLYSLATWDWETLKHATELFGEKWHHLFVGLLGAIITPTGAYHCRDKKWEVCGAVAGVPLLGLMLYAVSKADYIRINSEGKVTFGWMRG